MIAGNLQVTCSMCGESFTIELGQPDLLGFDRIFDCLAVTIKCANCFYIERVRLHFQTYLIEEQKNEQ